MSIWQPTNIEQEPVIELNYWSVIETLDHNDRHFVGYVLKDGYARVSSPITFFNDVERYGVTATGRKYKLNGESFNQDPPPFGRARDISYVTASWKKVGIVSEIKDVTTEYERNEIK